MTDNELDFCMLCGPLEDAIDMLDAGNTKGAKAVMLRVLQRAQEICDREREKDQ